MYIFLVLQLRAGWLILIWMSFLASLSTCLASWFIIIKREMLARGWLLEMLCLQWWDNYWALYSIFKHLLDFPM